MYGRSPKENVLAMCCKMEQNQQNIALPSQFTKNKFAGRDYLIMCSEAYCKNYDLKKMCQDHLFVPFHLLYWDILDLFTRL